MSAISKFALVVQSFPTDSPATLKALRGLDPALSLGELKAIVAFAAGNLPCTLLAGVDRGRVATLSEGLNAVGGHSTVESSPVGHPMLLWPRSA